MSVEVKAHRRHTMTKQGIGEQSHQVGIFVTAEAMHDDGGRYPTRRTFRPADDSGQQAFAALYGELLLYSLSLAFGEELGQLTLQLRPQHSAQHHFALGVDEHHRGYPLHTIGLGDLGIVKLHEFADLCPAYAIFLQGILPLLCVGIK